jgi:hypothetical protein
VTVPVSDVTSLYTLTAALLNVAETALGTTTAGTPGTVYITPATPAFDCCPALIASCGALSEEVTSPTAPIAATGQRDRFGRIILAQITIWALRCAPKPPRQGGVVPVDQEACAVAVLEDGWALWNGITCAIKNGEFEDLCSIVHLGQAISIAEQGGCVGWQMSVRAELGGIPCTIAP